MNGLRAFVELVGDMEFRKNTTFYDPDSQQKKLDHTVLMEPSQIPLILEKRLRKNVSPSGLQILQLAERDKNLLKRLLQNTEQMTLLIDSPGGENSVGYHIEWGVDCMRKRGKEVLAFISSEASSTAAMAISSPAIQIHCLEDSRFVFHLPTFNKDLGDIEQLAKIEGKSVEELWRATANVQREYLARILNMFFGRPSQQKDSILKFIAQQLYKNEQQGEQDLQQLITNITMFHQDKMNLQKHQKQFGEDAERAFELYNEAGELRLIGKDLQTWGFAQVHSNIVALAKAFRERTDVQTRIGAADTVWNRFFTMAEICYQAKKQGIPTRVIYDQDGDLSLMTEEKQTAEITRIMRNVSAPRKFS